MANVTGSDDLERIYFAQRVAYTFVAPVILAVGLVGNLCNLLLLFDRKRFRGRLYIYLKVKFWSLIVIRDYKFTPLP